MPPDTPPSRVKKAWRRPGMADSNDEPKVMGLGSGRRRLVAQARDRGQMRLGDRQHLEHRAHAAAAGVGQPLQRAGNVGGHLRRGLRHQRDRAGLDAEPLEEFALRHRAVDARAEILGGAHQRLEIDMGGDVGLARDSSGDR